MFRNTAAQAREACASFKAFFIRHLATRIRIRLLVLACGNGRCEAHTYGAAGDIEKT